MDNMDNSIVMALAGSRDSMTLNIGKYTHIKPRQADLRGIDYFDDLIAGKTINIPFETVWGDTFSEHAAGLYHMYLINHNRDKNPFYKLYRDCKVTADIVNIFALIWETSGPDDKLMKIMVGALGKYRIASESVRYGSERDPEMLIPLKALRFMMLSGANKYDVLPWMMLDTRGLDESHLKNETEKKYYFDIKSLESRVPKIVTVEHIVYESSLKDNVFDSPDYGWRGVGTHGSVDK